MGKQIKWICVIILVLITGIIVGSYFEARNNEVVTYNFDVIGYDFIVRDFTLVKFKDKYYIPKGYRIEKRNSSQGKIGDIGMEISQDGKKIRTYIFGFEYKQEYESSSDEFWDLRVTGTKMKSDRGLDIKFNYTIDGVEKEDIQTVELDKHIDKKL
ncbi:hypothetical protein [Clostridium intestinale]|uniref:Uncharacterized protein n=1 Tax=Clostridium intestinale URNW TaxID=1294142 RepID=U2PXI7_9CLOT|nr:hypothetical protein [Clostridium intestinale]ERK28514.1 hypothetical protein CINTURNW_4550 [Clostridium intestinale URNW]